MAQHRFACQLLLVLFFFIFYQFIPWLWSRGFSSGSRSPSRTACRWGMLHQVVLRVLDALQEYWDGYSGLKDSKINKIWCCSYLLSTGHCTCVCLTSLFPALTLLKISREVLVASCGEKH